MTKKDIKRGDLVLLRDGRVCVVMKDADDLNKGLTLYGKINSPIGFLDLNSKISLGKVIHLFNYDDDLLTVTNFTVTDFGESLRGYDIMAVRKTGDLDLKFSVPFIFNLIFYSSKEPNRIFWDWEREEIKEITMAEVEEKFGCKVKIVKEESNG